MTNDHGKRIKEAVPSTPIEITGLNDVPDAGDRFVVFDDEKTARDAGEQRAKQALMEERKQTAHVTLDNLFDSMKQGELKEVDVIIKADVQGSVEALAGSLRKIDVEGVRVNIIHTAVGRSTKVTWPWRKQVTRLLSGSMCGQHHKPKPKPILTMLIFACIKLSTTRSMKSRAR